LGALVRWVEAHEDGIVVERRGKPVAVLIGYPQYQELQHLREQERKRQAFAALEKVRQQIAVRNRDLTDEEAYRVAGFSAEVIQETLASDQELAQRP
jgi:prevent-host-death family protein